MTDQASNTDQTPAQIRREALDQAIHSGCAPSGVLDMAREFEAYLLGSMNSDVHDLLALEAENQNLRAENDALLANAAAMSKSHLAGAGVLFIPNFLDLKVGEPQHAHDDTCQFNWKQGEKIKPGETIENERYFWESGGSWGHEELTGKILVTGGMKNNYYRAERNYLCGK